MSKAGIDISNEAVSKFMALAKKHKIYVNGVVADITTFETAERYDLIICTTMLHLIDKELIPSVIRKMKSYTKSGGINLLTVFTKDDIGLREHPELYFFGDDELKAMYEDWQILENECYTKSETHGEPHEHHICALMAIKLPTSSPKNPYPAC